MILRIDQDHNRFKQIVRGRIKRELKKYISSGELIGRRGKDLISIPLPQITIPRFVYGHKQTGGVGQGEGAVGSVLGAGESEGGKQGAGNQPSEHLLEVDISLDELAEMLRHFKRTYKETLKRSISTGTYRPDNPILIPIRQDKRYRSWKSAVMPQANAAIIYMMDVSGSMGEEQKEIVRIESFWIDTWLRHHYKGVEIRYIIHDAEAREVDRETFYHTRESGGTVISAAYKLCAKIIDTEYPTDDWNIYCLHFSDGDNWSQGDTEECMSILKTQVLARVNLFCYGQVESPYGTGQFLVDLKESFADDERVALSKIENKDGILESIKDFLGRGR